MDPAAEAVNDRISTGEEGWGTGKMGLVEVRELK